MSLLNLNDISLSLYSFGYGAGFIKDDRADFRPLGLRQLADIATKHSLGGLEFPIDRLVPDGDPLKIESVIDEVMNLGFRPRIDLEQFDASYLQRLIPVIAARQLGFVRVKTSNFYGGNRYQHPEFASDLQTLKQGLRMNLPAIRDTGVRILVENHQDIVMADYFELWDEFGSHAVGMTWDIGNSLPACETPLDLLAAAGEAIGNVHLKDYRLVRCDQGYRMVRSALGAGQIGLDEVIPVLMSRLPGVPLTIELGAMNTRTANIDSDDYWRAIPGKTRHDVTTFKQYVYSRCQRDENWGTLWEKKAASALIAQRERDELTDSVQFLRALKQ
jgi:sugar phosphate isomerase/epimerase